MNTSLQEEGGGKDKGALCSLGKKLDKKTSLFSRYKKKGGKCE